MARSRKTHSYFLQCFVSVGTPPLALSDVHASCTRASFVQYLSLSKGLTSSLGHPAVALPFKIQLRMWQILLKYESFLKLGGLKLSVPLAFQVDVKVCFFFYLFTSIRAPWVMFCSLFFWSPKLFPVCVCL